MTTTVNYGSVEFSGVVTRAFRQEPIYTEDGLDLLYHRITVAFSGYVHGFSNSASLVSPQGLDGADTYTRLRGVLGQKRQKFRYNIGGVTILEVDPMAPGSTNFEDGTRDVMGGPTPKSFNITHVAGSTSFRVEVEMECTVVYKAIDNKNTSGVLSNRWSCTDDIDANFYVTRTFDGVLKLANPTINPHEFRQFVFPVLQPGMRMERMSIGASSDNLSLKYSIVHKEIARAAPFPATSWKFQHSLNTGDGVIATTDIAIYLAGRRDADKKQLIRIAMELWNKKSGYNVGDPLGKIPKVIVESLTMSDIYSDAENAVEVRGRVRHVAGDIVAMAAARNKLGGSIPITGYNVFLSEDPRIVASAPNISSQAALAAHLQEPYGQFHGIRGNGIPSNFDRASI